ncbi:hypothetical protein NQ318_003521 [Aromia moschata]|uniref:Protein masquerade clip-domain domain-containing protein n=1 Tax=Aromia moschata TaxID=1265417 RepID=A0AAV8YXD1_9CUCU|nr:hypothetical protein NQ318_003521 [Aromia moschata]
MISVPVAPGTGCNVTHKGVCVPEKMADYCEAILNTEDLCLAGSSRGRPQAAQHDGSGREEDDGPADDTPFLKQCSGNCVSGIVALFCEQIDSKAHCPDDGYCCITPDEEFEPPSPRPVTTSPRPTTQDPGPTCPGFCLLNIMAAFCKRPSVLIPHTSNCKRGSVCCDNTRTTTSLPKPRPEPHMPPTTTTTTTVDPRPECPGSCIVSYLSFTCFRNAEMTEIFKCRKAGTKCCAPKSLIKEALGSKEEVPAKESTIQSISIPYTTPSSVTLTPAPTTEVMKPLSTTSRTPVYSKYVCG